MLPEPPGSKPATHTTIEVCRRPADSGISESCDVVMASGVSLLHSRDNVKPLMARDLALSQAIDKAFVTAFLLSGNAERAEDAVSESIARMTIEDSSDEELLQGAVKAAVRPQAQPCSAPREWQPAYLRLPLELRRVLCLARYARQCFVLRVLVGLPSEACAVLLNSNADQVDRGACAAMVQLASNRATRFATHSGCGGSGWTGSQN
jgi:hypothetical protein